MTTRNQPQFDSLFQPIKIGDFDCSNRIAMAPLTRCRCGEDRLPTTQVANYYSQRSGAGLIVAEATLVDPSGAGVLFTPGIYNQKQIDRWKAVTEAVHSQNGRIVLQLWHCGRSSHRDLLSGKRPVAPSEIRIEGKEVHTAEGKKPTSTPRALETNEILPIVKMYARAAKNAIAAGFDGIELHGANGYLIDQFLQSNSNQRTDCYGGSVENRFLFLKQILESIAEQIPTNKVGLRLSPNGNFNGMGSDDFRETFQYAAEQFDRYQGSFLHVLDGLDFGFHEKGEPITLKDTRQWYKGVLIGNCGYTAEKAEAEVSKGNADMIAFGRPFITNPDFPNRIRNNFPLAPLTERDSWYVPEGPGYDDHPNAF